MSAGRLWEGGERGEGNRDGGRVGGDGWILGWR